MASVASGLRGGRSPEGENDSPVGSRGIPWAVVAWLALLLIAGSFSILKRLAVQWANDGDMGHGFFVPLVAAYIAWQRRERLLQLHLTPSWWGAVVMLWGAIQGYLGMLGADLFLQRTSVLITLYGLLLLIGGAALLRALAFPLLLLPFMIPFPGVVYNEITFPLQLFASRVAEVALGVLGVPVYRDGNVLEIPSQRLDVAEACSGIRSLLSLSFLSLVYAYLFDQRVWMRWMLLAATLPIAIIANAGRITVTGLLSEVNPELAHGVFHTMEGWVIFAVAAVMLAGLHLFIKWLTRKRRSPA